MTISIKPGTYKELVSIPSNKPFISLIGQSGVATDVVITLRQCQRHKKSGREHLRDVGQRVGHQSTGTTHRQEPDLLEHVRRGGPLRYQRPAGRRCADPGRPADLDNVRFLGNQDTLYHNSASASVVGRAYFRSCYVEGDVDFIFGRGTGVFDAARSGHSTWLLQQQRLRVGRLDQHHQPYGYLFYRCNLTSPAWRSRLPRSALAPEPVT